MSPISSIGLAEVLILIGCAGVPLVVSVIAVAVILVTRRGSETQPSDPVANGTDQNEQATTPRLRYLLLAMLLLAAPGAFLILDLLGSVSVYLRFTAAYAAFWILVGALLLHGTPLHHRVLILGLFAVAVFSLSFVNWNSRKPFLRDFLRIEEGMTEAQVGQIVDRYIREIDLPSCLLSDETDPAGPATRRCVFYRHTDEGWGDSDWGVVAFESDRVARTEFFGFSLSRRSTPPGPSAAGGVLGQASYAFLRWEEGLSIMIWSDALESGEGSGTGSTVDPIYRYHGWAVSRGGPRFDWEVQTADGRTARFEINDTSYDLSGGSLFLITIEDGQAEVRQLQRDLSGIQPDRESIIAFAQSDPDVAAFAGVETDSR